MDHAKVIPSKSKCIDYITKKSEELHIPTRISLATAWTESKFVQFREDGSLLCNPYSHDYGIMQISIRQKCGVTDWGYINDFDWERVLTDWKFNIDIGLQELLTCYRLATKPQEIISGCSHFKGLTCAQCIARACYSAYNAGPLHINRYRSPENPTYHPKNCYLNSYGYDKRDLNFWNAYQNKLWMK